MNTPLTAARITAGINMAMQRLRRFQETKRTCLSHTADTRHLPRTAIPPCAEFATTLPHARQLESPLGMTSTARHISGGNFNGASTTTVTLASLGARPSNFTDIRARFLSRPGHNPPLLLSNPFQCDRLEMHTSATGYNVENHIATKEHTSPPDPANSSLSDLCALYHDKITAFLDAPAPSELLREVQRQITTSLYVFKEALDQYSLDEIALSYNGGKDCLVLLVLWLVALHRHYGRSRSASTSLSTVANSARHAEPFPESIASVYIQPDHPFPEVDEFVSYSAHKYQLSLTTLTKSMKAAFAEYLKQKPDIKVIFVGTRRNDPHGAALSHFNRTNRGWPDFMRCQPVIDWHYVEIWAFIRHFDLPYCPLYDQGYTSLGGTDDTRPNPKLKISNSSPSDTPIDHAATTTYKPAYELLEDEEERLGRP